MINIGIIGLGRVYGYHLPDLLAVTDKFKISAVYDVSEKRTREVAASLENCIACASYNVNFQQHFHLNEKIIEKSLKKA